MKSELIFFVAGVVIILVISTYLINLMETPNFLVLCGIVFVQVFIFMLLHMGLFGEKIPNDTCPNCLRKYKRNIPARGIKLSDFQKRGVIKGHPFRYEDDKCIRCGFPKEVEA